MWPTDSTFQTWKFFSNLTVGDRFYFLNHQHGRCIQQIKCSISYQNLFFLFLAFLQDLLLFCLSLNSFTIFLSKSYLGSTYAYSFKFFHDTLKIIFKHFAQCCSRIRSKIETSNFGHGYPMSSSHAFVAHDGYQGNIVLGKGKNKSIENLKCKLVKCIWIWFTFFASLPIP